MQKVEDQIAARAAVPTDYSELGSLCPLKINNLFGLSSGLSQLPNEANLSKSIENVRFCLAGRDHSAPTRVTQTTFVPSSSSANGILWPKQSVRRRYLKHDTAKVTERRTGKAGRERKVQSKRLQ